MLLYLKNKTTPHPAVMCEVMVYAKRMLCLTWDFSQELTKGTKAHGPSLLGGSVSEIFFLFFVPFHLIFSARCCGAVDIKGQNPQFVSLKPATKRSASAQECEVTGLVAKSLSACGFCLKALAP